MGAIDDADRIRLLLPDGSSREVQNVLAWNRQQDWAVLDTGGEGTLELAGAAPDSVHVGDRYFSIEGSPAGRILTEVMITGQRSTPGGGGWLATFTSDFASPGAPVVNEYGETVGVVGTGLPGATRLATIMWLRAELKGAPIVPIARFIVPEGTGVTALVDLRGRGEVIPALAREQNILSGGFAREIARTDTIAPSDQREELSAQEKKFVAFVSWSPTEPVKGQTRIQLYDADTRKVMESTPKKINIGKRDLSLSSWEIPTANLSGIYRADVVLNDKPIWRGFVKITK